MFEAILQMSGRPNCLEIFVNLFILFTDNELFGAFISVRVPRFATSSGDIREVHLGGRILLLR